jgi:hypothetical protein
MPTKKTAKPQRKVTVKVSPNGEKRYLHWLCAPGNRCLPADPPTFTENINWKVFRIMAEFIEGFEFLSKLKKEVTIFGSARVSEDDPYYKIARDLGKRLGKKGYTVITGGGPGIMEAGNRGANEAGAESVGLNIELPREQRSNQYITKGIGFHYFFTRKVMLSASSQAYIYFPGGFGTLDEMIEMTLLIQTGKIPSEVPVILVGRDFWRPLLAWMEDKMLKQMDFIEKPDLKIMQVVDTVEEAMAIIEQTDERQFG